MQTVIETADFLKEAARCGLDDADRAGIVTLLANDPEAGQLIKGTGGYRKLRVAGRGQGKSGGYRVITFFTGADLPVFLITIYSKGDQDSLSDAQKRAMLQKSKDLVASYKRRVATKRR